MASHQFDVVFYAPFVGPMLASRLDASVQPTTGGAERQVFLVARALASRGWRSGVVVYDAGSGLPANVDGVALILQRRTSRPQRSGQAVMVYGLQLANYTRAMKSISSRAFVQRAAGIETGLVAITAKLRRSRFVYSSANVVDFNISRLEPSRLKRAAFSLGVRLADTIVVQTQEQERLNAEGFGRPARTIHSIAEVVEGGLREPEAFLWVGRPAAYKNPWAFIKLAQALPEARFRMVGLGEAVPDNPLALEISAAASRLENVEVLPGVPHAELGNLLDRAVAVVNTAEFEGMPNALLECWARGVPALALQHDPDGVIERENLGFFAHGSQDKLRDYARSMWQARHDQAAFSESCRAYIRRAHGVDAIARAWEEALGLVSAGQ